MICCQDGEGFAVGVLVDGPAGLVVGFLVTGRVGVEAVQRGFAVDQDYAEFDDLVFVEAQLFLEHSELAGGAFGGRERLLGVAIDGQGDR